MIDKVKAAIILRNVSDCLASDVSSHTDYYLISQAKIHDVAMNYQFMNIAHFSMSNWPS